MSVSLLYTVYTPRKAQRIYSRIYCTNLASSSAYNMVKMSALCLHTSKQTPVSGTWLIQHSKQDDALESKEADS